MSRRHLQTSLKKEKVFTSSEVVKSYLTAQLRHQGREIFAVLFLDSQHRLICYKELFQGTIDSTQVHPREVVKLALEYNAAALILAHNHPSGLAEPSTADQQITQALMQALEMVDIRVLDHLVVGEGEVVSFAERGHLPCPKLFNGHPLKTGGVM